MNQKLRVWACGLSTLAIAGFGCTSSRTSDEDGVSAIAQLSDCDESDIVADLPWSGPGIDPQTGKLKDKLPEGFVVASTVGWPTDEGRAEIQKNTIDAIGVAFTYPALLAAQFGTSKRCGSGRSLQIWKSQASMMEYVFSKSHLSVMPLARTHTKGWETTHWSDARADQLPTWEDSRSHLRTAREDE